MFFSSELSFPLDNPANTLVTEKGKRAKLDYLKLKHLLNKPCISLFSEVIFGIMTGFFVGISLTYNMALHSQNV